MKTLFALDRPIFFHNKKKNRRKKEGKSDALLLHYHYCIGSYSLMRALITEASMMETNRTGFVSQGVKSSLILSCQHSLPTTVLVLEHTLNLFRIPHYISKTTDIP